jgi:hypothetical protein
MSVVGKFRIHSTLAQVREIKQLINRVFIFQIWGFCYGI